MTRDNPRQYFSAFLSGAVSVLGFAPFNLFPVVIAGLALLFYFWLSGNRRENAMLGFFYGFGLMGFGVFWLHVSIAKFGGISVPVAAFLALLFAAFMALFFALAGYLSGSRGNNRNASREQIRLLLVFPAVWVLVEWLRSEFFTGFPWLSLGYSQMSMPYVFWAPVLGVFGVSWMTALTASLLLLVIGKKKLRLFAVGGLVITGLSGVLLSGINWTEPTGKIQSVRMVQANIPQEVKWDPRRLESTLDLYRRLGFQEKADLIIWPETAIPAFSEAVDEVFLKPLAVRVKQQGSVLMTGIPVRAKRQTGYYNALMTLGDESDWYAKRHLVPFGEYPPLEWLLKPLADYFSIPMSDFRAGDADRPLLNVGAASVGVSICYEDVFGAEVAEALPDAGYLVNISNDAWFGDSLAPWQHLQMASFRALETGRYLLRATNTGISAIIRPDGSIQQQTGLQQKTVLQGDFQVMSGRTPYVIWTDKLLVGLMFASLLLARFLVSRF